MKKGQKLGCNFNKWSFEWSRTPRIIFFNVVEDVIILNMLDRILYKKKIIYEMDNTERHFFFKLFKVQSLLVFEMYIVLVI